MKILLVDNGSLKPAAVFALREVARQLSERVGQLVIPVSLAHSDKIPATELGAVPARCLEAFLREELEKGDSSASASGERRENRDSKCEFVVLPFFIGPSRAVTHALPKLVEKLRTEFPNLSVRIAPVLHAAGDDTLARILAERVRDTLAEIGKTEGEGETGECSQWVRVALGECHKPELPVRVALVDHGSPAPEVTAVRDEVAAQLAALLREDTRIVEVAACSMERRPGADYAFNEPLLETLLVREKWRGDAAAQSLVIVAQLFLLPGRHAGPRGDWCANAGGDIAQICARVKQRSPNLRTMQTEPLATHPLIVELLEQRLAGVLAAT